MKSGHQAWQLKVYDIRYNPDLERDITSLARGASDQEIIVTDDRGRRYVVDVGRRRVS